MFCNKLQAFIIKFLINFVALYDKTKAGSLRWGGMQEKWIIASQAKKLHDTMYALSVLVLKQIGYHFPNHHSVIL
jgi:hypothetical protein